MTVMIQCDVEEALERFDELAAAILAGAEVMITAPEGRKLRLVPPSRPRTPCAVAARLRKRALA